jgi:UDP-2,3-diacylglucosamine pyrophosphatase LpxH
LKRKVELVVISDVHLGTFGSHAIELNRYLCSIKPKILVLNGDIIDIGNSENPISQKHI